MASERQAFIDWMKALGMLLIVTGHVIGSPFAMFNEATQPIYTKQLGVAFFIFIMGWGLARESGSWVQVLFKRLFQIYFFGISCALLLSVVFWFATGDLNESNYLPFIAGVNVLVNYFPANPTTWYIGTYLHVLLFWAVLVRHIRVTPLLMLVALLFEMLVRGYLISLDKDFVAYMTLPNWLTVFLLGCWLSDRKDLGANPRALVFAVPWLGFLLLWSWYFDGWSLDKGFPFRSFPQEQTALLIGLQSALISVVYLLNSWLCFEVVRRLVHSSVVQFFARNTLLVFIIHMPIIFEFSGDFYRFVESHTPWGESKQVIWVVVLFVGLSLLSEMINRLVKPHRLQRLAWQWSEPPLAKLGLLKR